jgi:hypothetical protein
MSQRQAKPIRIFFSELTRRFYASRAYREEGDGLVIITDEKFDVTNEIASLIDRHNVTFKARPDKAMDDEAAPVEITCAVAILHAVGEAIRAEMSTLRVEWFVEDLQDPTGSDMTPYNVLAGAALKTVAKLINLS